MKLNYRQYSLPRVLIVDDHKVIQDSIALLAEKERKFQVVAMASDGDEAIDFVHQLRPDIVLLDIHLPTSSGLEIAKIIRQMKYGTQVIVLTMYADSPRYVREFFEAGVRGYVTKISGLSDVSRAIQQVMKGEVYLSPEASRYFVQEAMTTTNEQEKEPSNRKMLSEREIMILKMLANGKTNEEIADLLSISPRTVEGHRHRMFNKTGERNLGNLVRYAFANGFLTIEDCPPPDSFEDEEVVEETGTD